MSTGQTTELIFGEAGQQAAAARRGGRVIEKVTRTMDWHRAALAPDLCDWRYGGAGLFKLKWWRFPMALLNVLHRQFKKKEK